jgi:predicted  nucleic acid-binding Zn-ribbon protein
MAELGKKYECAECGAKFYDLGKPEPICPKCGTNQRGLQEPPKTAAPAPRTRAVAPPPPPPADDVPEEDLPDDIGDEDEEILEVVPGEEEEEEEEDDEA